MKRNYLIVEDEPTMRMVIRKVLLESGLEIDKIYEANNGKEGLQALEKFPIDVMLVDIYMPVMDGMEMLDHVMSDPRFENIPAVVVSTENDENRIDAIIRKGIGFVHKPFTKELLKDQIIKMAGE
ncbi:MAG: response regulator [Balneolaceae bacterium]|nr:MAG: response regulator [Balneolaceae bacterium]